MGCWSGSRSLTIIALLALLALAIAVPQTAAGASGTGYVALGDSYTSGTYVPYASSAPLNCVQSKTNYPKLVASKLGLSLTDVSCGGATVSNFTTAQYPNVPPQFDALSASTAVVTVGIGGNDNNTFITALVGCGGLDAADALNIGAPCKAVFGNHFANSISADEPNIAAALARIHVLSPLAKVFVVGYPDILPLAGRCYPTIPLTTGDIAYLNGVEADLNAMLATAAAGNGATFVDTFTPSIGHDACKPIGIRWIEPFVPADVQAPVHPNALGEAADAADVEAAMRAAGIG